MTKSAIPILLTESLLPETLWPICRLKKFSPINSRQKETGMPTIIMMAHPTISTGQCGYTYASINSK